MIRPRHLAIVFSFALLVPMLAGGCNPNKNKPVADGTTPTPVVEVKHESGATIVINNDTDPNKNPFPRECPLSKGNKPDEDHVRWYNTTGKKLTLTFKQWPFLEREEPIVIESGAYSAYYTLDTARPAGSYTYESDLPFPGSGPTEPAIVDGP